MTKDGKMIYAVDFDGTLSLGHCWPEVGEENKPLFEFLIREQAAGAKVILWTNRSGSLLMGAKEYCKHRGLKFDAVNENLPVQWCKRHSKMTTSRIQPSHQLSIHILWRLFVTIYIVSRQ